jgi:hypothetical protein
VKPEKYRWTQAAKIEGVGSGTVPAKVTRGFRTTSSTRVYPYLRVAPFRSIGRRHRPAWRTFWLYAALNYFIKLSFLPDASRIIAIGRRAGD